MIKIHLTKDIGEKQLSFSDLS